MDTYGTLSEAAGLSIRAILHGHSEIRCLPTHQFDLAEATPRSYVQELGTEATSTLREAREAPGERKKGFINLDGPLELLFCPLVLGSERSCI